MNAQSDHIGNESIISCDERQNTRRGGNLHRIRIVSNGSLSPSLKDEVEQHVHYAEVIRGMISIA